MKCYLESNCQNCQFINRPCLKKLPGNGEDEKLLKLITFLESNYNKYECNINFLKENCFHNYKELSLIILRYYNCLPRVLIENYRLESALFLLMENQKINSIVIA